MADHDHDRDKNYQPPQRPGGILGDVASGLAHAAHEQRERNEQWQREQWQRNEALAIQEAQASQNIAAVQATALAQAQLWQQMHQYQGVGAIELIRELLERRQVTIGTSDITSLGFDLIALRGSLQAAKSHIAAVIGQLEGDVAQSLLALDKML